MALAVLSLTAIGFVYLLFVHGAEWVALKIMPTLTRITSIALIVSLIVGLPLSISKRTRSAAGSIFASWSVLATIQIWLFSLLTVLQFWGALAVVIGLLMGGVGVIPLAFIASLFGGHWHEFFGLLLSIVLLMVVGGVGHYLADES